MKKLYLDIGGTRLRSELVEGETIHKESIDSRIGLSGYIERQLSMYRDIGFIGVSYAGQVENGKIIGAPNIDIDEYDISSRIATRYRIPLKIDNDLNCAVRAEADYWKSAHVAALYVGTGIGAALIDGGKLVRGSRNMAYEIGHIPYKETPLRCGCGRSNCIELYASGSGMAKWLDYYALEGEPNLERLKHSSLQQERDIAEGFEEALIHAAGVLITVSNPELLVLGGGVIANNPYLMIRLRERLNRYAFHPALRNLRIESSALENAPLEGAKLLEREDG